MRRNAAFARGPAAALRRDRKLEWGQDKPCRTPAANSGWMSHARSVRLVVPPAAAVAGGESGLRKAIELLLHTHLSFTAAAV